MTLICILRGGLFGFDGPATSFGMDGLARQITTTFNIAPRVYNWSNYDAAVFDILHTSHDKLILIGYSGGGTRAIYAANDLYPEKVNLLVLYDPSPRWEMQPVRHNVKRVAQYYNETPMMPSPYGMLGGGRLAYTTTTKLETVTIRQQHLKVQANQQLHDMTLAYIRDAITTFGD